MSTRGDYRPVVGFIGLGDQGLPMAEAIAGAGFAVQTWARRPEVLDDPRLGALTQQATATGLAAAVDLVAVCISTDDAVSPAVAGEPSADAARSPNANARAASIAMYGASSHKLLAASFCVGARCPVQGRAQVPGAAPERAPGHDLGVMIGHHDHLLCVCQVDAHSRIRHRHQLTQPGQPRVPVAITPGSTATVTHGRPPHAYGIQARQAHQEDVFTSRTDTQNKSLCRCRRRGAG